MKRLLLTALLSLALPANAAELTLKNAPAQVYFSPNGGAQEAIVQAISKARSEVLAQAYTFTSRPIAEALGQAHRRGVRVVVLQDTSQPGEKLTGAARLKESGVPVFLDAEHAIAHNKLIVLDGETVITGSFNFTRGAEEKNAENVLIIKDKALARLYRDNWEEHRAHSAPYR